MPDYPGAYVEEVSTRTREIAGVPTTTAAFVGFAPSGPTDPIIISSIAEYEASFGKTSVVRPRSLAVTDFFRNGGTKAVIVRVSSDQAGQLIGNARNNTGLHALSRVDEPIGLLVLPDAAYLPEQDAVDVVNAAASLAEARGAFHIADIPKTVASKGASAAVQWSARVARNRTLAIYYPWVVTPVGTRTKAELLKPPSALAAGIYARLDQVRGVWKAPAGEEAKAIGITDLAGKLTSTEIQALQSAGINTIRKMPGGEIVLWGARTFADTGDSEWKYVNVRRLFLFLERSIEEGLQWAVFEPNGEDLWAQVRLEVSSFLHTAWRADAFRGIKPEEAYFVRCDATTMTQDDIDDGRLIAMIGIAPVKPAEFVIFRIGLATAQSP
jgi:phage tail sheath protein FI